MLEYRLYKFGEFLACSLPWSIAYKVGIFFSTLQFLLSKKDREAVINNLRIVLPDATNAEINKKAKEVFINFGLYLVEFLRFKSIDRNFVEKHFFIQGGEIIDEALKEGKGAILLTAHIGNWELGGMALALLGYKIMAIALDHKDVRINNFFKKRREAKGMEVVSLGVSVKKCFKALKDNKFVAVLGDRDFSNTNPSFSFLGRKKNIPRGPVVLSLRTGAPIIPIFVMREGLTNFKIECFPSMKVLNESEESEVMKKYIKIIEQQICKYPTQWLMFREFWRE